MHCRDSKEYSSSHQHTCHKNYFIIRIYNHTSIHLFSRNRKFPRWNSTIQFSSAVNQSSHQSDCLSIFQEPRNLNAFALASAFVYIEVTRRPARRRRGAADDCVSKTALDSHLSALVPRDEGWPRHGKAAATPPSRVRSTEKGWDRGGRRGVTTGIESGEGSSDTLATGD